MLAGPAKTKEGPVTLKSYEKKDPDQPKIEPKEATPETPKVEKVLEKERSNSPDIYEPIDLENFESAEEIGSKHSLNNLKAELIRRGLKCGGSLEERGKRLWLVRGLKDSEIPKKLRAVKS